MTLGRAGVHRDAGLVNDAQRIALIQHRILAEKVKSALARAGLPIAATLDGALSSGVFVEIVDDERLPPELLLKWRVHPILREHFLEVAADRLQGDPVVREMKHAERAMNTAIIAILEFSGFSARVLEDERVGEILVGESGRSGAAG
ncbi:hypothetical protein [Spongiactinospora sp. TRM90649]|uniref:hypothetical protein n=1 Tax=Spongiactinospora sp. TRM90649 TaxID=3031114 RepID=UPI0023F7B8B7|nr:hypothetical protein [Spongiactinospora sp. TRM90649]MDF5756273.1 hypothetical protein [Spongiactinospora sp. TRM90649]